MNFNAYIERQKSLIRGRHEGEIYLLEKGEEINLTKSEKIFYELSVCKGFNVTERMYFKRKAVV